MPALRRACLLALVVLPAVLAAPAAPAQSSGPDYLASDNVEFVKSIRAPSGLTAGARVVGHYLYVTSSKDLEIYDITKPEDPQLVSDLQANIQFENEEVPTNGKLLGVSSDLLNSGPECLTAPPSGLPALGGCLRLYDVRNPASVKELPSVPGAGDHTQACILDCQFLYGSAGTIVDATTALLPGGRARIVGNWKTAVKAQGVTFKGSCHNVRELRPGIILTACQPFELLSVLPQDGGSVLVPKVLATGGNADGRFIHSGQWPREGTDKFALVGGETNFKPQCGPTNGAFMTFDASHARQDGKFLGPLDEIRPVNGSYLDSNPPLQVLGCSVHWFEQHPTFKDGGLVALAEYENGTRFLQIQPDGKIKEQGYFIPLGGSTSAPHWAPTGDILYAVDYERGLDVLRYKGDHYVPTPEGKVIPEPGRVAGTQGAPAAPPARRAGIVCASSAGFERVGVRAGRQRGSVRFTAARRQRRPFTVDLSLVARGRTLLGDRRLARFRGRTGSFDFSGRLAGGRALPDGYYVARFTMRTTSGRLDVRRVALRRVGGRFSTRADFLLRDTCGPVRSYALSRPVFGGRSATPLRISYRLDRGLDSVDLVARRGGQVIRRFAAGAAAGRTYRFSVPARDVPPGRDVTIEAQVHRANAEATFRLVARRL